MTNSFADSPNVALSNIARAMNGRTPSTSALTFGRPAGNTTAYADGDALFPPPPGSGTPDNALVFEGVGKTEGGSLILLGLSLVDFSAPAQVGEFDLMLFREMPATLPVDNAEYVPSSADMDKYAGFINVPASMGKSVGNVTVYELIPNKIVSLAPDSRDLFVVPVTRNAYTPADGGQFKAILQTMPKDLTIY